MCSPRTGVKSHSLEQVSALSEHGPACEVEECYKQHLPFLDSFIRDTHTSLKITAFQVESTPHLT